MRETPFLVIFCISCTLCYTDSSNRFDEIVSTMAANRDPYSQWHVQAEITRDIEMIGYGGKNLENFLKICILLWLKMPHPAVFKHFLETKTLRPILEKTILCLLFKNLRNHFFADLPDQPDPPHQFYYIFVQILRTNILKNGGSGPIPPLGTPLLFRDVIK